MNKRTVALSAEQYKEIIQTMKQGFSGCRPNERIAAALLNYAGIETNDTFRNNAAYIQNWLTVLKNDKRMVVAASGAAAKAVDYILG